MSVAVAECWPPEFAQLVTARLLWQLPGEGRDLEEGQVAIMSLQALDVKVGLLALGACN